ncbi:hypothetical protein [uncultured Jannaschia sp.]|uniref:hypothetical protein n=1 Tax=uncultured Jannaschia sp. TaxID=293347 RepID=UPI0026293E86|nr:hypothetical protein [uncultured Jannaschia sp.]
MGQADARVLIRTRAAVTPFRYTRLLFGTALGIVLFGEALTAGMLVGSGLIVLSGLFILWRGQKKRLRSVEQ